MKARLPLGLFLSAALLILSMGPSMAQETPVRVAPLQVGAQATPAASAVWYKEVVDGGINRGQYASVAVDPVRGSVYISYYDAANKDLWAAKYVRSGGNCWVNNGWQCQMVDGADDVGQYGSIAVDPVSGYPRIAYYDATHGALKYASLDCTGGDCAWTSTTVDSGSPPNVLQGQYASLKIDSTGKPHIAYYSWVLTGTTSLSYATTDPSSGGNCGSGAWECTPIDTGSQMGQFASLDLDGSDQPSIAYYDGGNGDLKFAYMASASALSLAHIGITADTCPGRSDWRCMTIDDSAHTGPYASLAIDKGVGGTPHIAYYDTSGKLKYARISAASGNCGPEPYPGVRFWQCDTIDDSIGADLNPRGISLGVDAAGNPLIAYYDNNDVGLTNGVLKLAQPASQLGLTTGNCGVATVSPWQCDVLDDGDSGTPIKHSVGQYASMVLNSAGLATVAYYDGSTQDVYDGSTQDVKVMYQRSLTYLPLAARGSIP